MRIAALYDIHANLPALEAVLRAIDEARVDTIVIGGDVLPGPMPCETIERLLKVRTPLRFLRGNGDREVLAVMRGAENASLPEEVRAVLRWTAEQVRAKYEQWLAGWPETLSIEMPAFGEVLFCHATPRNDTEIFTRLIEEERLLPVFQGTSAGTVVCGHTHMQFDRRIGNTRVVNAGSVGMPFGEPGAYWLMLGTDIELRRTGYALGEALERIRATGYPQAREFAERNVLRPPSEGEMLKVFARAELK